MAKEKKKEREDSEDRSPTLSFNLQMQIVGIAHVCLDPTGSQSGLTLKLLQRTYLKIYTNLVTVCFHV